MTQAAVYARISLDITDAGLGVARQLKDCEALAARKGWLVAQTYVDNDVSASSGKPRPQYERMMAALSCGELDALVCWNVETGSPVPRASWKTWWISLSAGGWP